MVINNLMRENKQLQDKIKDMKKFCHCARIDELSQFRHELKGGHDQFSLLKIICIVVFFIGIVFSLLLL